MSGDVVTPTVSNDWLYNSSGIGDIFTFTTLALHDIVLVHFDPVFDHIDLRSFKWGENALNDGHVVLTASGTSTIITIDPDAAGPLAPVQLATAQNTTPAQLARVILLTTTNDFGTINAPARYADPANAAATATYTGAHTSFTYLHESDDTIAIGSTAVRRLF